eukprot:10016908-Ditylum_brightwellii.AAC.1
MLIDVNALDLLATGMSNISSMLAVFPAEMHAVVSSSAKLGGSKFSMLTSLTKYALSLGIGNFFMHISRNILQNRFPMCGRK